MPEVSVENTIQISPQVRAANHAALAAFFEERALVASQSYMDAVAELSRAQAEIAELRAAAADLPQPEPGEDEHAALVANLKRVNTENEELRASLTLMSKPRPQDQEDHALAELLRGFIITGVFTKAAAEALVRDAMQIMPPAEPAAAVDTLEGEAG